MVKKKSLRKKIIRSLLFIALIQIILLVSLPISQGYLIGNLINKDDSAEDVHREKLSSGGEKIFSIIKKIFTIKQIGFVSAIEDEFPEMGCCVNLNEGGVCSFVERIDCKEGYYSQELCDSDLVDECDEGYCFDEKTGICSHSSRTSCEEPGKFVSESYEKCNQGCCIIGTDPKWTTSLNCEYIGGKWFSGVESEIGCRSKVSEEEWGSCIYEDGNCDYTLEWLCKGEFSKGNYCPLKETSEEIKTSGVCFPELSDHVYNIDRNGNPSGILEKCEFGKEKCQGGFCADISCSYDSDGDGKDEKYDHGESWCVFDSSIGERKPAELGGLNTVSSDTPGSTHYLAQCVEGEVRINPCAPSGDRRNLCVNNDISSGSIGEIFKQASCEINLQSYCLFSTMEYLLKVKERLGDEDLEITEDDDKKEVEEKQKKIDEILNEEKEKLKENCEASSQCSFKNVEISDTFNFPSCVGSYPHGTGGCTLGTRTCTVYFQKNAAGRWVCEENCDCLKEDFIKQMNDHCISLGDCGSSINYVGDFSNNIDVKLENSGRLNSKLKRNEWYRSESWCDSHYVICPKWMQGTSISELLKKRYSGFENIPLGGNKPIQSLAKDYELLGEDSVAAQVFGQGFSNEQNFWGVVGSVSGGLGIFGGLTVAGVISLSGASGGILSGTIFTNSVLLSTTSLSSIAGPAIGAFLGAMFGAQVAKWAGQGSGGAILYIIGFSIIGLVIALEIIGSAVPGIGNAITAVIAIVAVAFAWITGWGKTKTVDIEFNCNEWQAPAGVSDDVCNQCTDPDLIEKFRFNTCTEYKCESLGQNCQLINGNSELNKRCVSSENDGTAPILSVGDSQPGFRLIKGNGNNNFILESISSDKCINGGDSVWFEIKSNEPVQCKYSFRSPDPLYDLMEGNFPLTRNDYLEKHKFEIEVPLLETIDVICDENEEGEILCDGAESGKELNLYLKCQDIHGNYNINEGYILDLCVGENIDNSPPKIKKFDPENNKEYPYNPENIDLKIYLDEPSECKWSNESLSYEAMKNKFSSSGIIEYEDGYLNKANLRGLKIGTNKYYIKCNDTSGNIGSYTYSTRINSEMSKEEFISKNGLVITSFSPDNESILSNGNSIEIELKVKTSKGANEGNAICRYNLFGDSLKKFDNTEANSHAHNLILTSSGNYSVNILCEDLDKISSAKTTLTFNLLIDNTGPEINYRYENGNLIVETNEPAKCSYRSEECGSFEIEEGEPFDFDYDFVMNQSVLWNPAWKGYSIMCIDEMENSACVSYGDSSEFFGPQIIGIFENEGYLELKTNIDAKCYYSFEDCQSTEIDLMNDYFTKTHKTGWNSGVDYYIKCQDEWENWGECVTIRPSSLNY